MYIIISVYEKCKNLLKLHVQLFDYNFFLINPKPKRRKLENNLNCMFYMFVNFKIVYRKSFDSNV